MADVPISVQLFDKLTESERSEFGDDNVAMAAFHAGIRVASSDRISQLERERAELVEALRGLKEAVERTPFIGADDPMDPIRMTYARSVTALSRATKGGA